MLEIDSVGRMGVLVGFLGRFVVEETVSSGNDFSKVNS